MKFSVSASLNATAFAAITCSKGYEIVSGGTDNHCFLIDLRNKNISGKDAEQALVSAEITVNKNMVPFDDKSPFVTSGIRIGTPAITTRGLLASDMVFVANAIDRVISNASNEDVIRAVKMEVHEQMSFRPLFA